MARSPISKSSALYLLLVLVLSQTALGQKPELLWSVDLSKDKDFQRRLPREPLTNLRPPTLDFLDDDSAIVAFDDNSSSVPHLGDSGMRPFGFHVLEVDARQGKLGRKLSWKVLNDSSQAVAASDNTFLVLQGEELRLFSSTFEELNSRSTPLKLHGQPTPRIVSGRTELNPYHERWQIDLSPSGSQFVLAHEEFPEVELEWLSTRELRTLIRTKYKGLGLKRIFAGNNSVVIAASGVPPQIVTSSGQQRALCNCFPVMVRPLNDDLFFLAMQRDFKLVSISGDVRAKGKLKVGAYNFHRALKATRFAYSTGYYRGSGFPLRTSFAAQKKVIVFDWTLFRQVAELEFKERPIPENGQSSGFAQSAVALSPDGQLLLVLINSTLNCYRLSK